MARAGGWGKASLYPNFPLTCLARGPKARRSLARALVAGAAMTVRDETAIVAEAQEHASAIERVLVRAFGPGRYAKTSERVREQGAELDRAVSRVAVRGGGVVGCCRMWRIGLDGGGAYFLGPLAIDPDCQGQGLARPLIASALEGARATTARGVVVIGRPALFAPFGFQPIARGAMVMPGPTPWERLQSLSFAGAPLEGPLSPPRAASPA
jgi:predicted N-acetyltransferase YhbS